LFDFYLSVYLITAGIKLIGTRRESIKKVAFVFEDKPERLELTAKCFSGKAKINPLDYKANINDLKTLLYNS
jgi:hypothetical protein